MKRLIFGVGAIILSVAYFAEPGASQDLGDLTGSWEFTMEPPPGGGGGRGGGGGGGGGGPGGGRGGRGGPFGGPQTLVLSVQDGALQGTLESERGSIELTNFMLDGTKITFTVTRETPRGSFEAGYTGELDGNTMSGTMQGPRPGFTINWKATRTEN